MSRDNGDFTDGDEDGEVDYDYNIWEALDAMAQAGRLSRRDCIAMYVNPSCHTLYTPRIHPVNTFITICTPVYTRFTCIHTIYTRNTPLNTL